MNVDGIRILGIVGAVVIVGVLLITAQIIRNLRENHEHQLACERIGGVLVRQDRGGAVCVQRALPPSAKGVKLT
jgi:hypothetical protein